MDGSRDMPLGDVRDLMRQNTGEFILITSCLEQARVHPDIPAGQGECIDIRVLNDEESETVVTVIGLRGNPVSDLADVLVDQRIFYELTAGANLLHDHAADTRFLVFV